LSILWLDVPEDKSILALLRDPTFAELFTPQQRQAIDAGAADLPHAPATRQLPGRMICCRCCAGRVCHQAGRQRWPRYLVGHQIPQSEWEAGIKQAMGGLYIAQRMLPGSEQQFPAGDGEARVYHGTLGMAMVGGKAIGMYHRISTRYVTNLNQGGGKQNVLIYDDTLPVRAAA
jgi:hypothetical protein